MAAVLRNYVTLGVPYLQCQQTIAPRQRPMDYLMLLPVPKRLWQHVTANFITQLPLSDSYNAIVVFVDQFTKMSIFVPTTSSITSEDFVSLFTKYMCARQSIPDTLTMDCGTQFTTQFWSTIAKLFEPGIECLNCIPPSNKWAD